MQEVNNGMQKVDYRMPEKVKKEEDEVDFKIAMVAQPKIRYQFSNSSQETNPAKPLDPYG